MNVAISILQWVIPLFVVWYIALYVLKLDKLLANALEIDSTKVRSAVSALVIVILIYGIMNSLSSYGPRLKIQSNPTVHIPETIFTPADSQLVESENRIGQFDSELGD